MGDPLRLGYARSALDFLAGIPAKHRRQITEKINLLAIDPHPNGSKRVLGAAHNALPVFRQRSGDYRILYAVESDGLGLVVLDIGNRKDVYRRT